MHPVLGPVRVVPLDLLCGLLEQVYTLVRSFKVLVLGVLLYDDGREVRRQTLGPAGVHFDIFEAIHQRSPYPDSSANLTTTSIA